MKTTRDDGNFLGKSSMVFGGTMLDAEVEGIRMTRLAIEPAPANPIGRNIGCDLVQQRPQKPLRFELVELQESYVGFLSDFLRLGLR